MYVDRLKNCAVLQTGEGRRATDLPELSTLFSVSFRKRNPLIFNSKCISLGSFIYSVKHWNRLFSELYIIVQNYFPIGWKITMGDMPIFLHIRNLSSSTLVWLLVKYLEIHHKLLHFLNSMKCVALLFVASIEKLTSEMFIWIEAWSLAPIIRLLAELRKK